MILREVPVWFARLAVVAFGLIWGSFLNVVIYRVPRDMSVVSPPSHCPGCGKPVRAFDNVPVLSYVVLRGRARCCGAPMSPRYPIVELLGGALSLAILEGIIFELSGSTPVHLVAALYLADFTLALGLLAAAFIDAEHMILPDSITLGGLVLGVATATLRGGTLKDSLVGALIGFCVVAVPFTFLYKGLLGRTGMALGDAKLVALAGAWFGWQGALFTLFAGAVQGSIYAFGLRVLGIRPSLPAAVLEDIEQLKTAAAAGDEEAQRELLVDPLTEDENDAFLLRWARDGWAWFRARVLGRERGVVTEPETPAAEPPAVDPTPAPEPAAEEEAYRARIAFGPFLILGCLELLFAGDRITRYLATFFGTPD